MRSVDYKPVGVPTAVGQLCTGRQRDWLLVNSPLGENLRGAGEALRSTSWSRFQTEKTTPQRPLVLGKGSKVDGRFCACLETTDKLIDSRRLETCASLECAPPTPKRWMRHAARREGVLSESSYDVPFALCTSVTHPA